MALAAEKELKDIGKTAGCADHDHDLVHELSKRLDAIWRYDQYLTNAKGHPHIEDFWRKVKGQEQGNVEQLKNLIGEEVQKGCF